MMHEENNCICEIIGKEELTYEQIVNASVIEIARIYAFCKNRDATDTVPPLERIIAVSILMDLYEKANRLPHLYREVHTRYNDTFHSISV